jgi:hypothetical protein
MIFRLSAMFLSGKCIHNICKCQNYDSHLAGIPLVTTAFWFCTSASRFFADLDVHPARAYECTDYESSFKSTANTYIEFICSLCTKAGLYVNDFVNSQTCMCTTPQFAFKLLGGFR